MMFISGIYALSDEFNRTESGLSTGAVDIDLKEYSNGDNEFTDNGRNVMPGDEISLIPRVNNLGIDCYLRSKIIYKIDGDLLNELDYINGNYTSWTKNGDYYYYDSIFGKEESIDLFNKITIPNVLAEEYQGKDVTLQIIVEAVQAKNFDGDWNSVEIKESVDRTYDIDYDGESSVIYENDVYRHITISDNFFSTLGNLLPGDSVSEEIIVRNSTRDINEYFVSIDYEDLTDDEIKLLEGIKLIIKDKNGKLFADSNLADKARYSLGTFDHGLGNNYVITISLPKEVDNEYSKLFTKINWNFSYDVIKHREELPINPKTGDFKIIISITVFILSSIGLLIVLIIGKKSTDLEKNNEKREERI